MFLVFSNKYYTYILLLYDFLRKYQNKVLQQHTFCNIGKFTYEKLNQKFFITSKVIYSKSILHENFFQYRHIYICVLYINVGK